MKKRLLSLFLAMAMILSCLSAMTFASAADPDAVSSEETQTETQDETTTAEETGDTEEAAEDTSEDDGKETAEEETAEEPVEEESEAEASEGEDEDDDEYVYVLMNIPYEDFYEDGVDAEVDAVSAATSSKSAFYNLAGGGYTGEEEGTIDGVTYYVLLSGAEYLELEELGYETVDADDAETITWTKRGSSMSEDLTGAQCLFTKGDYAYYVLTDEDDTPDYYLTAEVDGDEISITGFSGKVDTSYTATAELTTDGRHTDYEIEITTDLSDVIGTDPATYGENAISAVTVNTEDGDSCGLLHVVHIWTGFEIGWNYDELEELQGQTITSVTYYTTGGVYEVELEEGIYVPSEPVYVLMNVPYSDFYSVLNDDGVDTVTSATLNKTRTGSLAGGSYHVNSDGSDITGIIYYVRISEAYLEELELNEITDDSSVTISVTNRGTTTETTYTGSEALFEAESYSYYMLDADAVDYEAPAYYLEAEVIDGELSFTELVGEVTTISDVEYDDFTDDTTYGDYELDFDSDELSEILNGATVSAVTVNTSDGSVYGLRHIENIWRDYKLAWSIGYTTTVHGCTVSYENYADMEGKTIESVTYYTTEGIYQLNLAEAITLDAYTEYLVMNVPYEDFYGAVDADVDAVSAATSSKSAFYNLAGGGYTGAEEGTIDGVTYYVAISKADYAELAELDYETVNDSDEETIEWTRKGTAMSATLTGSECLFTKGDYAYYVLTDEDDTPDYYLTAEIEDGEISFTGFTGSADTSYSATAELTLDGRHTDYEIEITTDLSDVIGTDPASLGAENAISAVTVNTEEGNSYGLLHVVHIWTGFEIGWNYDELEDLQGQTITSVTYYTTGGVYEVALSESLYIPEYVDDLSAALDSSETTITLSGIPSDAENVAVTVSCTDADGETVELTASYNSSTGALTLSEDLSAETTYTISVTADNYIFEDVTVTTSVWYTISFEANRGKGSMDDLTVVAGSSVTLTKNSFTRSGYTFKNWNTESDGSGTRYKAGATITPTSDLTLYAQWAYDVDDDDDDDEDEEEEEEDDEDADEDVTEESTGESESETGFVDVADDAYYADAVDWAVAEGITTGTTSTTFSPDQELTRAQLVTMLYRLAGSPDVTGLESPFTDISDSGVSACYDAIVWAYNSGVAKGTSETTFSPFQTVTRAEAVTFLYRYYGEPAAETSASLLFEDVADTAYYADAVVWAVNEGVTTGTTETTFSPDQYTTRAQFVTFLYRAAD